MHIIHINTLLELKNIHSSYEGIKLEFYDLHTTSILLSFNDKIKIPQNIKYLIFGDYFNAKVKIPLSVTHLCLGYFFSQKIKISQNITHLT